MTHYSDGGSSHNFLPIIQLRSKGLWPECTISAITGPRASRKDFPGVDLQVCKTTHLKQELNIPIILYFHIGHSIPAFGYTTSEIAK